MSHLIQLGPEEAGMVSLVALLRAAEHFNEKPTQICYATSSSTTMDKKLSGSKLVLKSVVPVPRLVEHLRKVVEPQLNAILVPASSQFVAIVHPISTALPFKRLHRKKDNESQFEQENLAPVFKIMAYYIAYKQIQQQIGGAKPGYTAVFKLWSSPQFQKSHFRFFSSLTISTNHITDFAIHLCLPCADGSGELRFKVYAESFTVKAVIEVKTNTVLTDSVFEDITGWYENHKRQFVLGMVIQYVWQTKENVGDVEQLRHRLGIRFSVRRRGAKSGDLYISPPYKTVNNLALYLWLASAAFELHGINSDTIITPDLNKDWWNHGQLPIFESTGIRPATLPKYQAEFQANYVGLGHGPVRVSHKRKRNLS